MLFLVYLSLVTVTAIPLDHALNKGLLQSFTDANPKVVKDLKDYVVGLIEDGRSDIASYTSIRDNAQEVFENRTISRKDAKKELDNAAAHHADTIKIENAAIAHEEETKEDRAAKLKIKNDKKAVLDTATETDRVQQIRLNKEKALFEKVKGLLNGIKAESRRLLDAESDIAPILALINVGANADPEQVKQANELLDQLIAEGETERQSYIDALAKAQAEFDEASDIHASATAVHVKAMGALERAIDARIAAKAELDFRTDAHSKAVERFEEAEQDLKTKQNTLDTESARIQGEELDLNRIMDLLNKLD